MKKLFTPAFYNLLQFIHVAEIAAPPKVTLQFETEKDRDRFRLAMWSELGPSMWREGFDVCANTITIFGFKLILELK